MTSVDAVFASTLERARKLERRLRIQWDPQFNKWAVVLGLPDNENDWILDESLEEALIRLLAEERNQWPEKFVKVGRSKRYT